jgi:hypothetical protein
VKHFDGIGFGDNNDANVFRDQFLASKEAIAAAGLPSVGWGYIYGADPQGEAAAVATQGWPNVPAEAIWPTDGSNADLTKAFGLSQAREAGASLWLMDSASALEFWQGVPALIPA